MIVDPVVTGTRVHGADAAEVELVVPRDLHYFQGHFPGNPIVPGVVQIKWAIGLARQLLRAGGEFGGMEALKFVEPMQPGARATLKLEYARESGKLRFAFEAGRTRYSSGRLLLRRVR